MLLGTVLTARAAEQHTECGTLADCLSSSLLLAAEREGLFSSSYRSQSLMHIALRLHGFYSAATQPSKIRPILFYFLSCSTSLSSGRVILNSVDQLSKRDASTQCYKVSSKSILCLRRHVQSARASSLKIVNTKKPQMASTRQHSTTLKV